MRIVVKSGPAATLAQAVLEPEKALWSFGAIALACTTALFAYELMRPNLRAQASVSGHRTPVLSWEKASAFSPSSANEVLVKLPSLPAKYQKKVLYLWGRKNYLGKNFAAH